MATILQPSATSHIYEAPSAHLSDHHSTMSRPARQFVVSTASTLHSTARGSVRTRQYQSVRLLRGSGKQAEELVLRGKLTARGGAIPLIRSTCGTPHLRALWPTAHPNASNRDRVGNHDRVRKSQQSASLTCIVGSLCVLTPAAPRPPVSDALSAVNMTTPRRRVPRNDNELRVIATKVIEHLERCGIRYFRKPPRAWHSTSMAPLNPVLDTDDDG